MTVDTRILVPLLAFLLGVAALLPAGTGGDARGGQAADPSAARRSRGSTTLDVPSASRPQPPARTAATRSP